MTDIQLLGTDIFDRWTALWNGGFDVADDLIAPGFRVHFAGAKAAARGNAVRGPAAFAAFIKAHREAIPNLTYRTDGTPFGEGDRVVALWSVRQPGGLEASGIDVLQLADGKVAEAWSVTGDVVFDD